jgi:hypothetical protein
MASGVVAHLVGQRPSAALDRAEGVPVNVIQKQLGHVSLATTDIYLPLTSPRPTSSPWAEGGNGARDRQLRSVRPRARGIRPDQRGRTGTLMPPYTSGQPRL